MLGTKIAFNTAYHQQTDGLAERIVHTMEVIIGRLYPYGMEYKDHEGYTHYCVTLLPEIQLPYNTKSALYHSKITLTGRERIESLNASGSLEERSSDYPRHSQRPPCYVEGGMWYSC
ncbi:hypothetical protein O181_018349 [Austropuccinia psidii MF-1]|uniref:Integrase catalytic domain-containing protein n=1 Tax=Austropuccinia psidii MF-1 TaxID=1389203 RepID=A0A9Q3C560_9BASI|nr:hypothetical protein [Austropuccinia psidii MF-1]